MVVKEYTIEDFSPFKFNKIRCMLYLDEYLFAFEKNVHSSVFGVECSVNINGENGC